MKRVFLKTKLQRAVMGCMGSTVPRIAVPVYVMKPAITSMGHA